MRYNCRFLSAVQHFFLRVYAEKRLFKWFFRDAKARFSAFRWKHDRPSLSFFSLPSRHGSRPFFLFREMMSPPFCFLVSVLLFLPGFLERSGRKSPYGPEIMFFSP